MSDSRTRILDAAEELFAETGYDGTSTARIAEVAEVPKGLVFHYFPQKMDVLLTLVDERTAIEDLTEFEHPAQAPDSDADPAGALRRVAARLPLRASPRMRRILFREADTHRSVRERLGRLNRELVRLASRALEAALPGSRGDTARLEIAAATFATVLLYHENLYHLTGDRIDPDAVADLLTQALT
ncbi:helix-turn-helix domain-containing protein [Actinocorallia sp. A-T 12471]|uniref:TetR/AcrR family transcriptional regulator n=1 Tax=Actinocorallia sp. A-T 12471 TaxID=3089813 RepID=UPI0029D3BECF|nr:helix-turn-helix domain-containing protein [Actinocorallia sp. A-T 12471]MDX6744917.1 helix-turn-helix domain-containing protein [Actinocorallia sp. A-T 12471]